jgi:hypothetical protein
MTQVVQHKMVPPEPVAGSSKYYILPKPGIPPVPPKMSLAKEVKLSILSINVVLTIFDVVEIERKSGQKQNCTAYHQFQFIDS